MFRKSLTAAAAALSLVAVSAQAAPARVASPVGESQGLAESQAWMIPLVAILATVFIILVTDDDDDGRPVSP